MDVPKTKDTVQTTLRLPRELHKQLAHAAIDAEMDINALIVKLIEQYLKKAGAQ
jgi:predicted HicB family RNase H-like nuclease